MTIGIPETRQSLLVRLKNANNGQAWAEFEAIYRPAVYRFARRRHVQPADAEDLAQQVMLAVAKQIPKWRADSKAGSFRAWLLTVTRNSVFNFVRRPRLDQAAGGSGFLFLIAKVSDGSDVSTEINWELRRATFRSAASEVRREYQSSTWQAFWLTAVEGQMPEVVACKLGLSVGAVYTNRSRVLKRLREYVREFDGDSGADQ